MEKAIETTPTHMELKYESGFIHSVEGLRLNISPGIKEIAASAKDDWRIFDL